MKHKKFLSKLAQHLGWSHTKTEEMVEATVSIFNEKLSDAAQISIQDFGVFDTRKENEHITVNPKTKERFLMPPKIKVTFEPATATRENLKTDDTK